MKHPNNGACDYCKELMDKYPGFNKDLKSWFTAMQAKYKMLHISEAGRGQARQRELLKIKKTKASFGKSAHNWNCAIDTFIQVKSLGMYDENWYRTYFEPEIPDSLYWYGSPGAPYPELPHIEFRNWKMLAATGEAKLVEAPIVPVKLA